MIVKAHGHEVKGFFLLIDSDLWNSEMAIMCLTFLLANQMSLKNIQTLLQKLHVDLDP